MAYAVDQCALQEVAPKILARTIPVKMALMVTLAMVIYLHGGSLNSSLGEYSLDLYVKPAKDILHV